MDVFFSPEMGLAAAQDALPDLGCRVALVLPTTQALNEHIIQSQSIWSVIGRSGRTGVQSAIEVFRHLSAAQKPVPIIIHTDQLYQPADATILALLDDSRIYLSPVECILNDKHDYRLLVWTAAGLNTLPAKSPLKDIGSLMAQHLRDCSLLGQRWLERDQQVQRTIGHRLKTGKRQLRFLRSSVANAYMKKPASSMVNTLIERISDIGRVLEKEHLP